MKTILTIFLALGIYPTHALASTTNFKEMQPGIWKFTIIDSIGFQSTSEACITKEEIAEMKSPKKTPDCKVLVTKDTLLESVVEVTCKGNKITLSTIWTSESKFVSTSTMGSDVTKTTSERMGPCN